MRRSLSIIVVMGIVAVVLFTMLMNSFLARVGGADALPQLRKDLASRHGPVLEDQTSLKVVPKRSKEGEARQRWLVISFQPRPELAASRVALEKRMRMMARQVYAQPRYERRYDFVDVKAQKDAEWIEIRVTREDALTRVSRPPSSPRRR